MPRPKTNFPARYNDPFPTVLRHLLEEKHKQQLELANALNVSRQTVNSYTDGSTEPNYPTLINIAAFFNVSIDYLLGKSEVPSVDKNMRAICEYTGLSEEAVTVLHDLELCPEVPGKTNKEFDSKAIKVVNLLLSTAEGHNVLREILKFLYAQELRVPADPERNDEVVLSSMGLVADPGSDLIIKLDKNLIETSRIEAIRTALTKLKNRLQEGGNIIWHP